MSTTTTLEQYHPAFLPSPLLSCQILSVAGIPRSSGVDMRNDVTPPLSNGFSLTPSSSFLMPESLTVPATMSDTFESVPELLFRPVYTCTSYTNSSVASLSNRGKMLH